MVAIHHLADYGGAYAGSFVPMLAATARATRSRGWSMTIWLSDIARGCEWLPALEDAAEIRWLTGSGDAVAAIRPTMAQLVPAIAAGEPTVVHTHFSTYDMPAALVRLRRRPTAVFWHEHTRPVDSLTMRLRNAARYGALGRLVDGMLCVSPEIRALLAQRHAPADRLVDFPNAVDLDRFPRISRERRMAARRELGIDPDAPVVLHFGWDWERKGGDMMAAASELAADGPSVLWLTVGAPAEAVELRGRSRVRVLPPANDVSRLYAVADVFLSCSRGEGMPYAVLEALAGGLPVVGTDLPGQTPLISGLPAGEVVASDPAAIAAGVRRLLALSDDQRGTHARLARERVNAGFSLDGWVQRLLARYEQALA
jgi:glycosyltransferase involved in cell wall biosynthesis